MLVKHPNPRLFRVAGVIQLMNLPTGALSSAVGCKWRNARLILVGDQIGGSVPVSVTAEFWNSSRATVNEIISDALKPFASNRL